MASQILSQEKNPFLKREEFTISVESSASPSESEAKAAIGKDEELTVIKKINSNFGKNTFTIEAVVYDNAEAKNSVETIPQKIRKKIEEERKAKEAEEEAAKKKAEEEAKAAEEAKTSEAEEAPEASEEAEGHPDGKAPTEAAVIESTENTEEKTE